MHGAAHGPHKGAIGGAVERHGNRAHEVQCDVRFALLGDILVAADPAMQCGGMNVSVSGVYRRVRR